MQRISSLASCRDFAGLAAALSPKNVQPWRRTSGNARYTLPPPPHPRSSQLPFGQSVRGFKSPRITAPSVAGHAHRQYGTDAGEEQRSKEPGISVVGIPDPITWIRCNCLILIIEVLFELGLASVEFENGVKQAVVHMSQMMLSGRFDDMRRVASRETVEYVRKQCASLTDAQRQALAVTLEDIMFLLPEDVSIMHDDNGRKFCFISMRVWFLSTLEGPDDPEANRIFSVAPSQHGSGPQRKMVTAVYEFRRDLTKGVPPDWKTTNIWHWHWTLAK